MQQAINEAKKAFEADEIPIGAVVVLNETIIGRGHNQVELLNDPTAHAEMIALTAATNYMGAKYLTNCTLYVTIEPCLMCCGALHWSKVARIVWGADDLKNGHRKYTEDRHPFHPKTTVTNGILSEECARLMKDFFLGKR